MKIQDANLGCQLTSQYLQVLPLARKNFSFKRQQEILYQSLCIMPLRLIERVLPWLTASLTEDEAKNFLKNLQAGGIIYCFRS